MLSIFFQLIDHRLNRNPKNRFFFNFRKFRSCLIHQAMIEKSIFFLRIFFINYTKIDFYFCRQKFQIKKSLNDHRFFTGDFRSIDFFFESDRFQSEIFYKSTALVLLLTFLSGPQSRLESAVFCSFLSWGQRFDKNRFFKVVKNIHTGDDLKIPFRNKTVQDELLQKIEKTVVSLKSYR